MTGKLFLRFLGSFTLYILVVCMLAAFPLYRYGTTALLANSGENLAFFYVLILVCYYIVARATAKESGSVINAFLAGVVVTLLLAMVYLYGFMRNFPGHELDFAVTFFAAYLICTAFEVYYILHNLRQN